VSRAHPDRPRSSSTAAPTKSSTPSVPAVVRARRQPVSGSRTPTAG